MSPWAFNSFVPSARYVRVRPGHDYGEMFELCRPSDSWRKMPVLTLKFERAWTNGKIEMLQGRSRHPRTSSEPKENAPCSTKVSWFPASGFYPYSLFPVRNLLEEVSVRRKTGASEQLFSPAILLRVPQNSRSHSSEPNITGMRKGPRLWSRRAKRIRPSRSRCLGHVTVQHRFHIFARVPSRLRQNPVRVPSGFREYVLTPLQ